MNRGDGAGARLYQAAMRALAFLPVLLPLLLVAACQAAPVANQTSAAPTAPAAQTALPRIAVRVTSATATQTLTAELAATPAQQQRGLMGRQRLPDGHGMLFPFTLPRIASFWMEGTPAPLDLLFVAPDGAIVAILPGKPFDPTPISAGVPVSAVLELAAGSAARLGIAKGDRISWGDCASGKEADPPGRMNNPARFCPAR